MMIPPVTAGLQLPWLASRSWVWGWMGAASKMTPGVGVAVWAFTPSWPMFAASVSDHSAEQSLLSCLLVPGSVPGIRSTAEPALQGLPGWWGSGQVGLDRAGKVRPRSRGGCAGKEAY